MRKRTREEDKDVPKETLEKIGAFLDRAPFEAVLAVAENLPYQTLIALCNVSKKYARICRSELFWERKTKHDFGNNVAVEPQSRTWKRTYFLQTLKPSAGHVALYDKTTGKSTFYRMTGPGRLPLGDVENQVFLLAIDVDPALFESIFQNAGHFHKLVIIFPSDDPNIYVFTDYLGLGNGEVRIKLNNNLEALLYRGQIRIFSPLNLRRQWIKANTRDEVFASFVELFRRLHMVLPVI